MVFIRSISIYYFNFNFNFSFARCLLSAFSSWSVLKWWKLPDQNIVSISITALPQKTWRTRLGCWKWPTCRTPHKSTRMHQVNYNIYNHPGPYQLHYLWIVISLCTWITYVSACKSPPFIYRFFKNDLKSI